MSWSDPIVDEVWRARDEYAARFGYNLRAIFRDLKEQEKRSGRKLVKAPGPPGPNHPLQPTGPAPTLSDDISTRPAGPAAEQ